MLSVLFGYDQNAILSVDTYFNNTYDDNWLDDSFVRDIIRVVDGSEVQDRQCILSPVLGQIPPERLSGGAKALILMCKEEDFYTDLIVCGANCEKLILDMAEKRDISCCLSGYDISFHNLGDAEHPTPVRCLNDGSMLRNPREFVSKMLALVGGNNGEMCSAALEEGRRAKARHVIRVTSRKASYRLELERKISVMKGNSGTGKSSLLRLIAQYLAYGKKSGIKLTVDSSASLAVLDNSSTWVKSFPSVHDTVLFIDEDVDYLYSDGFQNELWLADCYAVIISRSGLFQGLPHSISGIYGLTTEKNGQCTTTSMYPLYEERPVSGDFESDNTIALASRGDASVLDVLEDAGRTSGQICASADSVASEA